MTDLNHHIKPRKRVKVGNLILGNDNDNNKREVYVQSMLNCPPDDIEGNIRGAKRLVESGCDIIRVAVPTKSDVHLISALKSAVKVPIVADIHYDFKIAVEAVFAGADKIRINPGNIGDSDRVKAVVSACKAKNIPIRIGVNSGSISENAKQSDNPLVASALENVALVERFDFDDIVISVKSSSVTETISAYRSLYEKSRYPLHLGVTEAGTTRIGLIKSSIGIGSLLCDGIGDTIRVSLTAPPEDEVVAGIDILKSIGIRKGVNIISCPTCGRCKIDVISLANRLELAINTLPIKSSSLTLAVMGCAVNGIGECESADFGITGGDGEGIIFKGKEIIKKVPEERLIPELISLLS